MRGAVFGFGFLCVIFLVGLLVYAGTHSASQILHGTFLGNFSFNGSIDAKNITKNGKEVATIEDLKNKINNNNKFLISTLEIRRCGGYYIFTTFNKNFYVSQWRYRKTHFLPFIKKYSETPLCVIYGYDHSNRFIGYKKNFIVTKNGIYFNGYGKIICYGFSNS